MMLAAIERTRDLNVSFEIFPPKTAEMEARVWKTLRRLAPLRPSFFSVTYGADGSTRERTHPIVQDLSSETGVAAAAHLTCVAASRDEVDTIARRYWDAGIRHLVALRGDPSDRAAKYAPHPNGYPFAADLVSGLKRVADFEISVAAYPEVHPEAKSASADLDNLKRKIDAGADRAITQFFFEPSCFLSFRDRAAAAGVNAPLVPGILPIVNFAQMQRFAAACGASVPKWLAQRFDGLEKKPDDLQSVAVDVAAELCHALTREGVRDFHFYTLNQPDLIYSVCRRLGLGASAERVMGRQNG